MKLETIAKAYASCVDLEDRMRLESPQWADEISELRGELHALLMDAFKEAGIPFTDRADAARLAFQLAAKTPA